MTFSVSRDQGLFEWAGTSLDTLFCQRGNLLSPKMWRMVFDIVRFNQFALDVLKTDEPTDETIGEYLEREGYSNAFRDDYLIPMTAAVWSTSPDKCTLDFPAVTLIRFLSVSLLGPSLADADRFRWNHHLLSAISARPAWLTIATGSKTYIDKVMNGFPPNHLRLNTKVTSVTNDPDGRVRLHTEGGGSELFDHVILATHGDQAYSLTRNSATDTERAILQHFGTSENTAVLHSDTSLLPASRKAWSSWNYLTKSSALAAGTGNIDRVSLTYNMNILQHIPRAAFGDVLVTLNPLHEPDAATVQGRYVYRHPLYTPGTVRAQQRLGAIQNTRGISYAGAWTGYGFHEDGISSGLRVAVEHLGASLPFEWVDSTCSRGRRPAVGVVGWLVRLWISVLQLLVVGVLDRLFAGGAMATGRLRSRVNGHAGGVNGRLHKKEL